jgi:predicted metal-binding protein
VPPHNKLCKKAVELGAKACKVIDVSTVKTAAWVRRKCQFGCSEYGSRLTCPPYSPTPNQTREILDCYKKALLIHCDEEADISEIVYQLEREAFLSGFYKAFGMAAGPCLLCSNCNTKAPCKNPEKARPSMEACGIDVFSTARNNGFTIEVLKKPREEGNYFGLLLVE